MNGGRGRKLGGVAGGTEAWPKVIKISAKMGRNLVGGGVNQDALEQAQGLGSGLGANKKWCVRTHVWSRCDSGNTGPSRQKVRSSTGSVPKDERGSRRKRLLRAGEKCPMRNKPESGSGPQKNAEGREERGEGEADVEFMTYVS